VLLRKWGWVVASGPADESKKMDAAQEPDDFDPATDLCDFGFVLAQLPAAEKLPEANG
jgi:hypothetical protein